MQLFLSRKQVARTCILGRHKGLYNEPNMYDIENQSEAPTEFSYGSDSLDSLDEDQIENDITLAALERPKIDNILNAVRKNIDSDNAESRPSEMAGILVESMNNSIITTNDLVELSHVLYRKSLTSNVQATMYRLANLIISLSIILIAVTLGAYEALQSNRNVLVIVVSFTLAGLNSLHAYFGIGKKGIYYKGISLRLKRMSSNAYKGSRILRTPEEMLELYSILKDEMYRLDLYSYSVGYKHEQELPSEATK